MSFFIDKGKALLVLMGAFLSISCKSPTTISINIANPSEKARPDELIILKRTDIEKKSGKIPDGKFVLITGNNKTPVFVQYDDINLDGKWDELVFLYSFKAKEQAEFRLSIGDSPANIKAAVRAHVRQRRKTADDKFGPALDKDSIDGNQPATDFSIYPLPPFLTEGPAWENDKIGFRLYFDERNGKDIWGKTTPKMIMDEVGLDTADNYHLLSNWGMDILKVGKSLGAGALALSVPISKDKDSLVRLGGKNVEQVIYQKIADGPIRAILRLTYKNWKVINSLPPVQLTEEISIWGGKYFYESHISLSNAPVNSKLVTGIVNLHSDQSYKIDTLNTAILYTHDLQSENKDNLGLGIMIKKNDFYEFGKTANTATDIQNTCTMVLKTENNKPLSFRFYAGWERSDLQYKTVKGFSDLMKNEAVEYSLPLIINWK